MINNINAVELEEIIRRWNDYSTRDVSLYKDLPDWRTIVRDIHVLLENIRDPSERDEEIQEAFNSGVEEGYRDKEEEIERETKKLCGWKEE